MPRRRRIDIMVGAPLIGGLEVGQPYTTGEGGMLAGEGEPPMQVEVGRPYAAAPPIGARPYVETPRATAMAPRRAPGPRVQVIPEAGRGPRAAPQLAPWWQDSKQSDEVASSLLGKLKQTDGTAAGVVPWGVMPEGFRAAAGIEGDGMGFDLAALSPRERELVNRLAIAGMREQQDQQQQDQQRPVVAGGPEGLAGRTP